MNIQSDLSFIKYYDLLFSKKDYNSETEYILQSFESFGDLELNNILDLGCGTGSHTIEFDRLGYSIIGLDVDKLMIDMATSKYSQINFIYGNITNHDFNFKYELIFSFFNVINYIDDVLTLLDFFKGVKKNLHKGGVFIFDCWNGNRVCVDPPSKKEIKINNERISANGILQPNYNQLNNTANFHYIFDVVDNKVKLRVENRLFQTFWSPLILKQLLQEAGFSKINVFNHLSSDLASFENYKLSFICL